MRMVLRSKTIRYGTDMARLARSDWVDAAYARFSEDGIGAVAVEPIARMLGSTKGSFYWHFADRGALVDAVLERWRELETEDLIRDVDRIESPKERLAALLDTIAHRTAMRSGERTLYADAAATEVSAAVAAVTDRRVQYLEELLVATGIAASESHRRAVIVVAAVIGFQQLVSSGWDAGADPRSLVETLFALATDHPKRPET